MAAVKGRDTRPELALRALLRTAGLTGYRLNYRHLPGRPDVAYTRWKVAVFVDGAFWHGHPSRIRPDRLNDQWIAKIEGNRKRDQQVNAELASRGWTVVRIWDFELNQAADQHVNRIERALQAAGRPSALNQP